MQNATCSGTFVPSFVTASSAFPGSAVAAAKDLQHIKYASLASSYHLVPFSVETSHIVGPFIIASIKEAGCHIADREDYSCNTSPFQRLSLAIVCGNSFSILGSSRRSKFS